MNREILNITSRILSEEIDGRLKKIRNKIFEDKKMKKQTCSECGSNNMYENECMECGNTNMMEGQMCSECGNTMYEGECMECGNMYEGDIQELGGMDDGHPRFGKKRFKSPMSIEDIEKLLRGDDEDEDDNSEDIRNDRNSFKRKNKNNDEKHIDEDYDDDDDEPKRPSLSDLSRDMDYDDEPIRDREDYSTRVIPRRNENPRHFDSYRGLDEGDDEDSKELMRLIKNNIKRDRNTDLGESLKGNQRRIDMNRNNKIDSEDFKLLRKGKKTETKESGFPDLSGDGRVTRKDILLGRGVKLKDKKSEYKEDECKECGNMYELHLDESTGERFIFSEYEIINIIENVVNEEKKKKSKNKKSSKSAKNITRSSQAKSKSENDKYIGDVVKKMKDYLKTGSKGEYEMNPKHFPKGNGELEKMDKMAYVPSDTAKEYIDNFTGAGLENIDYDEIHPNEKWVSMNILGNSLTGNNPEWANAVPTSVNKNRDQIRTDNLLSKVKKMAYQKDSQPVKYDRTGSDSGDDENKLTKMLKTSTKKSKSIKENDQTNNKINEDIEKIKNLIGYNQKTQ